MRLITACLTVLITLAVVTSSIQAADSDTAMAEIVMNQYVAALKAGDVEAIKALVGGALRNKRLRLLNNPTYPEYLRNTYQMAAFTILENKNLAADKVTIRGRFDFQNQQSLIREFILLRENNEGGTQFRIHSESTP
ncbi:MAG: hypothetical protein ABIK15_12940 [Pseudomonadota bacterium]